MKRFCVIGLGNFGYHVARALFEDGHEVVAIDSDKEKVQRIQDHVSYAIIGDAANKDFLVGQGIAEMDAVIVSTGERSHLSTLITLYLRELRVPRILVKAISEDHGRILEKVGATEIIFPEKDMARRSPAACPIPTSSNSFRSAKTPRSPRPRRRPISSARTWSNSICAGASMSPLSASAMC